MEQLQDMHYNALKLHGALWCFCGFRGAKQQHRIVSDLDRSRLTDTRSTENDWIRADTNPEYLIDVIPSYNEICLRLLKGINFQL